MSIVRPEATMFQPNLLFVDKARRIPQSGALERCFTWGRLLPYLQTLYNPGKACEGQTL